MGAAQDPRLSEVVGPNGAAAILGVKVRTVHRYKATGGMPATIGAIGATPLWLRADVEKMKGEKKERTDGADV